MIDNQKGFSAVYILLTVILVALIGGGAYYIGTKNSLTLAPSQTPVPSSSALASASPEVSSTPSPTPNPTVAPAMLENIKASIVSKNTAALEGYMENKVNVIIEATECCGDLTKVKAISELDYLSTAALPWNFDDNNPIAIALKQKNPDAFPEGVIIGTSANRMLVSFTLNEDKTKIAKIYMAVDYKLQGI